MIFIKAFYEELSTLSTWFSTWYFPYVPILSRLFHLPSKGGNPLINPPAFCQPVYI